MKNLELKNFGVVEMDAKEMNEIDGGIIPLLIIGCCLLLSSCGNQVNVNKGPGNQTNYQKNKVADTLHGTYHPHVSLK